MYDIGASVLFLVYFAIPSTQFDEFSNNPAQSYRTTGLMLDSIWSDLLERLLVKLGLRSGISTSYI